MKHNNLVGEILSKSSILDEISKRIDVIKQNNSYKALCPFHQEKTPSFSINVNNGFFYCFGCHKGGNVINFIMDYDNIDFKDTIKYLAKTYNIDYSSYFKNNYKISHKYEKYYNILLSAINIYKNNLFFFKNNHILKYLYNRGIDENMINKFNIGFADQSYSFLKSRLANKFDQESLIASGLFSFKDHNNFYDKFRNRIMFPIYDDYNMPIGFGARVIDDNLPKYLNSPETFIFKKNQFLYNFSNAKGEIRRNNSVFVVEGYMDVISLSKHNINNVVAQLGTAISSIQIDKLFNIADNIYIICDGDNAGINAMKKIADLTLEKIRVNKNIIFVILPDEMDPDDFVKSKGKEEFLQYVNNNQKYLSDFIFDNIIFDIFKDYNIKNIEDINVNLFTPEVKSKIEYLLNNKISKIKDFNIRKYFNSYYNKKIYQLDKNYKYNNNKNNYLTYNNKNIASNISAANNNIELNYFISVILFIISYRELIDYKVSINYKDEDIEIYSLNDINFSKEYLNNIKEDIIHKITSDSNIQFDILDFTNLIAKEDIDDKLKKDMLLLFKNIKMNISNIEIAKKRLEILILKYYYLSISADVNNLNNSTNIINLVKYKSFIKNYIDELESILIYSN